MPWRVGRDFRHLSQAAHIFLERSRALVLPLCVIAKPIHSARGVLWPPAVAPKLKHSHASIIEPTNVLPEDLAQRHVQQKTLESVLRLDKPKEGGTDGNELISLAPPSDVLSTIGQLFVQYPSRCTVTDLRKSQGTFDLVMYLRHPRAFAISLYLLEQGLADRALWVLELATQIGASCPPRSWQYLTAKFAEQEEWRGVRRIVKLARQRLGYTTVKLLNWRLRAWMENQRYVPVEDVLAMFETERVNPSRLTYHLLVAMHLRNCDLAAALTGLRAMESAGFPVTAKTCAILVLGYRSFGLTASIKARALAAIGTGDEVVSAVILNGLVQLLLDAEDSSGVAEVLSSVSQPSGDRPYDLGASSIQDDDERVGSSTPSAASRPSSLRSTQAASQRNLISVSTYNILLDHLSRQGDLTRAMHVVQQMRVAQVSPDSKTAAALVRLYSTAGFHNDALHVVASALGGASDALDLLTSLGFVASTVPEFPIPPPIPPTIHLLNALLRSLKKTLQVRELSVVLDIMRIMKVNPNAATITIVLSGLQGRARPGELIKIVRLLKSRGVVPARGHLHVLLQTLLSREQAVARPRGWSQLRSLTSSSSQDTPASSPRQTEADVAGVGCEPTAGITFSHFRRGNNLLRPIVQSLSARNVRNDRVTFALRIKHFALVKRDLVAAHEQFRLMVRSGFRPNRYHYGALMQGYAAAGNLKGATKVMRAAADAGLLPDVKMYTIIIAGYAGLARPKEAMRAFRSMVAEGITPDVPAIDALVSAFFRKREYGTARRVLLRLWTQVAPFPDALAEAPLKELARAFRALHAGNANRPERLTRRQRHEVRRMFRDLSQWGKTGPRSEAVEESARHVHNVSTS
ncbi:hypothetical protein DICSQDRAFT_95961 [Dichomitus squalens LYAD-421 SS1]|uniref:uncharacterized protein n=1 Tax=Dichomitus squalens (strain LYAD-421) TaxID=732165 RepID=UPI00044148B5|nr:uncharacterized protein DICSQDRAFT_95961 [Dichomitus squalens LYAD-421 SS1]EJF66993.1 hypothetical protein DICSQDRAFT_95961 [Dichomitus squalens LYAD-421 SS1]